MKLKLILIALIASIAVTSCEPVPTNKKTDIPVEVVKLKEIKNFDTLLVINTDKKMYQFDYKSTTNDYVTTIDKTNDEKSAVFFGMVLGVLLSFLVIGIVTIISGDR